MSTLAWSPVTEADLTEVVALVQSCLAVDGGLPDVARPDLVRRRYLRPQSILGRDETGEVVAVAAVRLDEVGAWATGAVHPAMRGVGIGRDLVDWARERAGSEPLHVIDDNVSAQAEELYAESGFSRTYATTVMRHDLHHIPRVRRPEGVVVEAVSSENAPDVYQVWRHSFAQAEPGPVMSATEWISWLFQTPGVRTEDSRLARASDAGTPIGFVTLTHNWIEQVGVVPAWRGHALGAHLVVRSLTAQRQAGYDDVWLEVACDNPSRALYERLGFVAMGTRGRYREAVPH